MAKLKLGDGIVWPNGAPIAAMVTFDYDAELLRYSTSGRDKIQFPDESRGRYGHREGLKRILEILERQNIKSTFFVPGYNAEKYREDVEKIVAKGHELGYHGYMHDNRMDIPEEEELENMRKSEEILEEIAGEKIVGHRAPTGMLHPYSFELMQKRGYLYSSVMKDRDWAYLHQPIKELPPVVELPTEHTLDDYTYFYFSFAAPTNRSNYPIDYVFDMWKDYFDELVDEKDKVFVLKLHPQLIGRSSRAVLLDRFITYMKEQGAWIASCKEVAEYVADFYKEDVHYQ